MIGVGQILETVATYYTELSSILWTVTLIQNEGFPELVYFSISILNSFTDLTRIFLSVFHFFKYSS